MLRLKNSIVFNGDTLHNFYDMYGLYTKGIFMFQITLLWGRKKGNHQRTQGVESICLKVVHFLLLMGVSAKICLWKENIFMLSNMVFPTHIQRMKKEGKRYLNLILRNVYSSRKQI